MALENRDVFVMGLITVFICVVTQVLPLYNFDFMFLLGVFGTWLGFGSGMKLPSIRYSVRYRKLISPIICRNMLSGFVIIIVSAVRPLIISPPYLLRALLLCIIGIGRIFFIFSFPRCPSSCSIVTIMSAAHACMIIVIQLIFLEVSPPLL